MNIRTHILGAGGLEAASDALRARHWQAQREAGLAFVTVGDSALHDPLADHSRLFDEVAQAQAQAAGHAVKAVLLGPLSFLWLGKEKEAGFDRFELLDGLLVVYEQALARLKKQGVEWVQIDEPILGLDLPDKWRQAFERSYWQLARSAPKVLLACGFSPLAGNLRMACQLPVAGLHVDAQRAPQELVGVADWLPSYKVLSIGIGDGREVRRSDPDAALGHLRPVAEKHRGELWLAPSCAAPGPELKSWLAFVIDKLEEFNGAAGGGHPHPPPPHRA